jgi:hypothetical protein
VNVGEGNHGIFFGFWHNRNTGTNEQGVTVVGMQNRIGVTGIMCPGDRDRLQELDIPDIEEESGEPGPWHHAPFYAKDRKLLIQDARDGPEAG